MRCLSVVFGLLLFFSSVSFAHFGAVIPSTDIVPTPDAAALQLEIKFMHPMELHYMEMAKPKEFGVVTRGGKIDLLDSLQETKRECIDPKQTFTYWLSDYKIKRPGDHTFYVIPQPYWEPAEDLFIVHYTKVTVAAMGLEDGWDQPVGLETEIVPLSRPYGLWTGNLFSGQVMLHGKPVPYAEIEVEYLNETAEIGEFVKPPADPFITQVIKSDGNGVFHYAMPRAGWWGFSALSEADWQLEHDGEKKGVEIGAVFWVHTRDMD
ncbi:cobalt/nickel transport protein [Malonomonas rubra DSM 5091]|uniref:Cobalt/nickel transport protein n=1 Tax=Malonomonas rubra DSM 5091 TaxID=1122189 RepID=A0A1M6E3P0_MALRU|nr:DUF4198 domain-containing protein [Malonomonas rubra]SHI80061.1 cobalt/nickel transport protein [Malonomonas rubra DSM 5091]